MIEVASWPDDLAKWDANDNPFYLEFFGETEPQLDEAYAEVVPAGGTDPKDIADAPVYEYWWTLGHPGTAEHHQHWLPRNNGKAIWEDLDDPAARVYLYFPICGGWRIKEIVATLKYLSPMPEERDWRERAAKALHLAQPLMSDAGQVAGLVPGGATASKWLETLSKLQVTSIPPAGDLSWSAGKVTFGSPRGVMQGVMWTLPRTVFHRLGGRLTGSLALSFIPARRHHPPAEGTSPIPLKALAHAVVYGSDGTKHWIPDDPPDGRAFVALQLSPRPRRP